MEENKMSEKESLELISQMISATRKQIQVGNGNQYLYWGYFTSVLSVLIYLLICVTHNPVWNLGWFMMLVFQLFMWYLNRGNQQPVVTYSDKMLQQVWRVVGWMFIVTVALMACYYDCVSWFLMLPLSLVYCSLGASITGLVIREPAASYFPLLSFAFGVYMIIEYTVGGTVKLDWYLYYAASFVLMMVIPGHIINNKAKRR